MIGLPIPNPGERVEVLAAKSGKDGLVEVLVKRSGQPLSWVPSFSLMGDKASEFALKLFYESRLPLCPLKMIKGVRQRLSDGAVELRVFLCALLF